MSDQLLSPNMSIFVFPVFAITKFSTVKTLNKTQLLVLVIIWLLSIHTSSFKIIGYGLGWLVQKRNTTSIFLYCAIVRFDGV